MPSQQAFTSDYLRAPSEGVLTPRKSRSPFGRRTASPEEEWIAAAVSGASDLSSTSRELEQSIMDWRSLYHLSSRRANILEPMIANIRGPILELGAGLGSITRRLGETGKEVFAVEGSRFRAEVCASRCRDLANVTVICDEISEFRPGPVFETVVMVGVLEYSRSHGTQAKAPDPIQAMLTNVVSMLAPGGELILAIENQMGLKYYAGFPEDHLGQAMIGVEDKYSSTGPVTFGHSELSWRLSAAGLVGQEWYYPFPDFKFPQAIVSDRALKPDLDPGLTSLIVTAVGTDPQTPTLTSFNLEDAWKVVCRNGEVGSLAHSFLVHASLSHPPQPAALQWSFAAPTQDEH